MEKGDITRGTNAVGRRAKETVDIAGMTGTITNKDGFEATILKFGFVGVVTGNVVLVLSALLTAALWFMSVGG